MILTDLCLRRPVLATVLNIMVLWLGLIAFSRLTVREYPNIDEPVITVETKYPGASAEIIETQIATPLEESLAGIEGIEVLSSVSRAESSQISVRFKTTRDPDGAANDVRDRVGRVRSKLPQEIDEPVIAKVEADAQPIIYLAFFSDRHTELEISDYADRYVKNRIQNLAGVSNVNIFGERRTAMRIWLSPERLAAYDLTPADVEQALRAQNVEIPAGRIESSNREFSVLSETDLKTTEQFEAIILRQRGTELTRLRDVGRAEVAPEDERRITRFNGKSTVALGVVKQSTANPLDVSKGVRDLMPELEKSLPAGMRLEMAYDSSIFIERSIAEVYKTIIEATILVVVVIFFFLRSFRATLIPMVAVPISLLGVCFIMMILGFTINTLTLLAFVLAIGMVVDDAIVVLENIHRHIEEGLSPKQAAIKGSREISFAVIAMTLTLAAVYTPVAFMTGRTGKLFTEFAITLAGAVVISGWLALTLSPVMCGAWLRPDSKQPNLFSRFSEAVIKAIETGYAASLRAALRGRFIIILIAVIVSLVGVQLLRSLKSELAPTEDRGTIVAIGITPEGSTIDYTAKWMRSLEPIFASVPEIQKYFVVAGFPTVSQGIAFVRLSPWEERNRTQMEIGKTIAPQMFGLPGMMSFPVNPPSLGRSARSQPIEYIIQTTGTYDELNSVMGKLMQEMQTYPGIANPDIDLKLSKPQLSILIARDKAAALGVQIDTIGRALETLLGGRQVTRFKDRGKQYDVIVQIEDQDRVTPSDIDRIYVRNKDNKMIPLSALLTITETVAPRELNHFNQMRSAKITANVGQGYTLGEALDWLDKKSAEILPASARTDVDGESREFRSTSKEVIFTFLLALGFIYLVLAAQFESYRYPLVILLTVPLSMTGALLALKLTGGTLNIYSQIGLITLIGLITKHGILIVEFSNQRVAEGLNPKQAVYEAATVRLRPVLMTTLAMVLGAVPLALSEGAGAESRRQIGWVIIGGMMIGTLFTLYVVPAIHSLVLRANSEKDNLDEKNFSQ